MTKIIKLCYYWKQENLIIKLVNHRRKAAKSFASIGIIIWYLFVFLSAQSLYAGYLQQPSENFSATEIADGLFLGDLNSGKEWWRRMMTSSLHKLFRFPPRLISCLRRHCFPRWRHVGSWWRMMTSSFSTPSGTSERAKRDSCLHSDPRR